MRLKIGDNDLSANYPELASQWHPTKNGKLTPQEVTSGSGKKIWWICAMDHEWEALISKRTRRGHNCPYCSGKHVLIGFNDLATTNPELALQLHPTLNGVLTSQNVTAGSGKKVWWICDLRHEWESRISDRTNGNGCPVCAGKRVLVGFNDLATISPELALQWHPMRNGVLTSQNITAGSHKKVWWICAMKHEWAATVNSRTKGNGCPSCAGKRVSIGINDLATTNPVLASQWHPTKNGILTPQDVMQGSPRKVWWICSLLHEWNISINGRTRGEGCPICAGRQVLVGFNDLATINPELASQWHPTNNGKLTPQEVTVSSGKSAWWICDLLHEWENTIDARSKGRNCPYCAGKRVMVGFNDLSTIRPELAAQWHPKKNDLLTPQEVTVSSGKSAWWICDLLHEWVARIYSRSLGSGCPFCSVGITEKSFRKAFEKLSQFDFESNRIELIRFSRKRDLAQIDMLNDDLKLVIEYDGEWTHGANGPEGKTLQRKLADDKETTQSLVDIGYKVIRIREHGSKGMLPLVPLDPEYGPNVFQISYKSFGKDKDNFEELVQRIIEEKADWFKVDALGIARPSAA